MTIGNSVPEDDLTHLSPEKQASSPKVHLFWVELILSPSIFILVKFRENKLLMSK